MSDFDYERAWRELAKPAFDALPAPVVALMQQTAVLAVEHTQEQHTLDVTWPQGLRAQFEALDDDTLARAARVVYFAGHWKPGGEPELPGGLNHWKFANYCDQVLRARVIAAGLPCRPSSGGKYDPSGYSYAVIEGLVRLCYQGVGWFWEEVGPGTVETVRKLQELRSSLFPVGESGAYKAMHGEPMRKLKAALVPPGHWAEPWLDVSKRFRGPPRR